MKVLPPNTFTRKQALAVCTGEAKEKILKSNKETFTVDEVNELRGLKLNGTDTKFSDGGRNPYDSYHNGLAEDDKIHSYDNNFDGWR